MRLRPRWGDVPTPCPQLVISPVRPGRPPERGGWGVSNAASRTRGAGPTGNVCCLDLWGKPPNGPPASPLLAPPPRTGSALITGTGRGVCSFPRTGSCSPPAPAVGFFKQAHHILPGTRGHPLSLQSPPLLQLLASPSAPSAASGGDPAGHVGLINCRGPHPSSVLCGRSP